MDELAAVQADLVAWGVLEAGAPLTTRRARAALARAATVLREEELAGQARPGHPLVLAAELALAELAPAGRPTARHHQMLAAAELASLPEGVQSMFRAGPSGPSP
jgi:hypothetical protein